MAQDKVLSPDKGPPAPERGSPSKSLCSAQEGDLLRYSLAQRKGPISSAQKALPLCTKVQQGARFSRSSKEAQSEGPLSQAKRSEMPTRGRTLQLEGTPHQDRSPHEKTAPPFFREFVAEMDKKDPYPPDPTSFAGDADLSH
ncbi:UNVERIFIED_CONTAM: hypothetical protein Sindi_2265900 [Sesamum indicum]